MLRPKTRTVVTFENTDAEVYNALEMDKYLKTQHQHKKGERVLCHGWVVFNSVLDALRPKGLLWHIVYLSRSALKERLVGKHDKVVPVCLVLED